MTNLLRRRMFNIEGLTAGHTEQNGISHITVVFDANDDFNAEQASKQLSKIIEVISVVELSSDAVIREIALINLHYSDKTKSPVLDAIKLFEGKVVSTGKKSVIVEITGTPKRIDQFLDLVRNCGIRSLIRSSAIAMKEEE